MSIRVIILGPYSATNILDVAKHIRQGMELTAEAAKAGLWTISCWEDWETAVRADLPMSWFKAKTIAWLEVAEAVLLAPGWEKSKGVAAEIEIAGDLDIPVFTSLESLKHWADSINKKQTRGGNEMCICKGDECNCEDKIVVPVSDKIRAWVQQGDYGKFMCEDMSIGGCDLLAKGCGPTKQNSGCPVGWRVVNGITEYWSDPKGRDGRSHCECGA